MQFLRDVFHLFYPNICFGCFNHLLKNETILCLNCRHDLPLTNFSNEENNLIEKAFYGRIPVQSATALFYYFKKSTVQNLIHSLKYKGQQQIGTFIGSWLADEMLASERFQDLDAIIPVPLHRKKFKKRGYNQVSTFGKELSKKMNIPLIENSLLKVTGTATQTKKLRLDRWLNVQKLFVVANSSQLENRHILLIDDIITTGATLEACYMALEKVNNIKISIACMAYTK